MGIKSPRAKGVGGIKDPPDRPAVSTNTLHPAFCFRYLQNGWDLATLEQDEKLALVEKIVQIGGLTWQEIQGSHRHGNGHEKIARSSIRPGIPPCVTDDVQLIAFRFHGKAPMVGYRSDKVFYVLWLDRAFTLYDHG
jgi:hypothetical protein